MENIKKHIDLLCAGKSVDELKNILVRWYKDKEDLQYEVNYFEDFLMSCDGVKCPVCGKVRHIDDCERESFRGPLGDIEHTEWCCSDKCADILLKDIFLHNEGCDYAED